MLLWVGNLDPNKDPLTVLNGFATMLDELPRAILTPMNLRLLFLYGFPEDLIILTSQFSGQSFRFDFKCPMLSLFSKLIARKNKQEINN